MALNLTTLRKPTNRQLIDPSTGVLREEWDLYLTALTKQLNAAVGELGTDPAPENAEYIVSAASSGLSAERVATDTATIDYDAGTAGQAKWNVIDDSITFAKLQNISTDRLIGRDTASSGDPEQISVGGGLEFTGSGGIQRSALTGDVAASAGSGSTTIQNDAVTTAKILNDAVTYAKLQNVSATSRILGRKTSGAGDPEECTLSEVLDFIGSAAQGDILYRGASAWERLAAGTSGQLLQTLGSGANPQWANASPRHVASGTLSSAATLDFTSIPSDCDVLEFELTNWRPATDNVELRMRFSQSSSFLAGASDYAWANHLGGNGGVNGVSQDSADNEIVIASVMGNASGELSTTILRIIRPLQGSFRKSAAWFGSYTDTAGNVQPNHGGGRMIANDNAIDGVRFIYSSGNIAEGFYAIRSYRYS